MAANNSSISTMSDSVLPAFDAFVGFIYATTIALVIKTAYLESKFNSSVPVFFTLLLLIFFAQDWMVRFRGRQQMSGTTIKSDIPYFLKFLNEITIVYFLLLASLRFVEIYAPLTFPTIRQSGWMSLKTLFKVIPNPEVPDLEICCLTAAFAFASGLWNAVMIGISVQVDKQQIWCFFKGHLDEKIVNMFPIIRKWQSDHRSRHHEIIQGAHNSASEETLWLLLQSQARNPHHLLVPYLLVVHIVALNYTLAFFIVFSRFVFDGNILFTGLWFLHVAVRLVVSSLLLVAAWVFLSIHFSTGKSETPFEWLACASLAVTILLFYSACPAALLICLVVVQQILANCFMTRYFKPSEVPPCHQDESALEQRFSQHGNRHKNIRKPSSPVT